MRLRSSFPSTFPVLLLAVLMGAGVSPGRASAQTTYQQSTGLTWSAATLELGMALSTGAMAAADPASAQGVGLITLGVAAIGSGVSAGVAQGTDAPVEPAMVFHHGFLGGALLGGLLSFSARAAGDQSDLNTWLGVIGLLAGAGAMGTYSVFRMERLAHDPELVEEAHVLSWTPLLSAGIVSVALTAAGFTEGAGVVGAVVGLVALGIGITLVEVAIAENPEPPDTMMMGAPLVAF